MADPIIITRHGTDAPEVGDLADHQLGYDATADILYIRDGAGIVVIGAASFVPYSGATGAVDLGAENLTTTGVGTFFTINASDPETGVQLGGASVFRMKGTTSMYIGPSANLNYANITGTGNICVSSDKNQWLQMTSGENNTAVGIQALRDITTGGANVGIGVAAGRAISDGNSNICIGNSAGLLVSSGNSNVVIGLSAMSGSGTAVGHNTCVGPSAGRRIQTSYNVAVGYDALSAAAMSGGHQTCVGSFAGDILVAGDGNSIFGYDADATASNIANATILGYLARGASGSISLGKSASATTNQFAIPTTITSVTFGTATLGVGPVTSTGAIAGPKSKITTLGGLAVKLTNKTGVNSVAGKLVIASTGTDNAVALTASGGVNCIGVFLDSGVADGSEAWVVVSGIANVLFDDDHGTTRGDWVSTGAAGYATSAASPAAAPTHFEEIGHCLETVAAGGAGTFITAKCVLHFN